MVEQPAVNRRVAGSSPASGAIIAQETEQSGVTDTALTQEKAELAPEPMKYPVKVKHRGQVLARIYKPGKGYPLYRVAWTVTGQRRMKAFPTYSAAKKHGDELVKALAKGSQAALLTAGQAADALTAFEHLDGFYKSTGRRLSLATVASVFCDSAMKLGAHNMTEAVDGFLQTAAVVKAKDVAQAVEEFITGEAPRTKASDGKRPEVSPKYHYNRAIMLRRFAAAFPSTAVKGLTKEHLDQFFAGLGKVKSKANDKPVASAKSRNHHRITVRQFLAWCVRKDYLPTAPRLNEADKMRLEKANDSTVEFYTPAEFKTLLEAASGPIRAMLALGGLPSGQRRARGLCASASAKPSRPLEQDKASWRLSVAANTCPARTKLASCPQSAAG
jgi:hypothetical protein